MGAKTVIFGFVISNAILVTVVGKVPDWTSFTVQDVSIDPNGMTSRVTKAISAIHCAMQCHADITCTGMNYGEQAVNPECRLFYSTRVSEFTMTTDPGNKAVLLSPTSCADLKTKYGNRIGNGAHNFVDLEEVGGHVQRRSYRAYCDQETDGGGWTVIQRRLDGSVDFYRGWEDYKEGFGNVDGEYWIGLDVLHLLTSAQPTQLRVDLEDFDGNKASAVYDVFKVANESLLYRLTVGGFDNRGAGDSLTSHNGKSFSTKDNDNDNRAASPECAVAFHGAWWYDACHQSNLNGGYKGGPHTSYADGVNWSAFKGHHYSLKTSKMKIRPLING